MIESARKYLFETIYGLSCVRKWGMDSKNQVPPMVFAVTPLVRYGPRYMEVRQYSGG